MHTFEPTTPPPAAAAPSPLALQVQPWPSELPLLVFVALAAAAIWLLLAISIVGIAYALLLAAFFFFAHVGFVAYLRGSAVRLGPEQFPALHGRVEELARRAGLAQTPEAYLLQAGGSLNAFATRFLRSRMVVLFSDLLDACGDDHAARDMVIGHELGHVKARHLDFQALLLPGMFVPFLGAAYSRARELTCDRYGAALCGDAAGAARGLAILAAGGKLGPQVNLRAYVAQRNDLDTGWMTLGRWLGSYPPLSARVEAIRPELGTHLASSRRGPLRATAILLLLSLLPAAAISAGALFFARRLGTLVAGAGSVAAGSSLSAIESTEAHTQVTRDLDAIEAVLREEWAERQTVPEDDAELLAAWERRRPQAALPTDPFNRATYGYLKDGPTTALVYSAGPDGESATNDDIDRVVELATPTG